MNGAAASCTARRAGAARSRRGPGSASGSTFTVTIDYAGTPAVVTDPDSSIEGLGADRRRRVRRQRAAGLARPGTRATTTRATRRPSTSASPSRTGLTVHGERRASSPTRRPPAARRPGSGARRIRWRRTSRPRRSGSFDLTISTRRGIPSYVAVDPQLSKGQVLSKLPEVGRASTASIYGPYPFNAVGRDRRRRAKVVGYSLETQTKPNFDRVPDEATLVHELVAHVVRRLGDARRRGPTSGSHEGFATWSEWIWSERQGNKSRRAVLQPALQHAGAARPRSGSAAGRQLPRTRRCSFNGTVYDRGAMTLRGAAREDRRPRRSSGCCRTGRRQNRYGNVTTAQFIALAEQDERHGSRPLLRLRLARRTPDKPTFLARRRAGGAERSRPQRLARGRRGAGPGTLAAAVPRA